MSKTKFKPLDLIENKITKEVEMVSFYINSGNYECLFIVNTIDMSKFIPVYQLEHYKKISPKKVKFNLK